MASSQQLQDVKKKFDPLYVMGIFWLVFGVLVLIATFFVQGTPQVPLARSVVTNLCASILLLLVGGGSLLKANANRRKSNAADLK